MKTVSLSNAYRIINHNPLLLVTSSDGIKTSVLPVAWYMPVSKDPFEIAMCLSLSHFTTKLILEYREAVLNIAYHTQIDLIMKCGKSHGNQINKIIEFDIPVAPVDNFKSPYITSCAGYLAAKLLDPDLAQKEEIFKFKIIETKVEETIFTDRWLIGENTKAKFLHHLGGGYFVSDGNLLV